jgi:hypothetical protein
MKTYHKLFLIIPLLFFTITACSDSVDSDNGDDPLPPQEELVYFWFFDSSIPNDTELEEITASFSAKGQIAFMGFQSALSGYPDTGRRAAMERRNLPTELNYRPAGNGNIPYSQVAGRNRGIQVKQPFTGDAGENALIFHLPLNGFENPVFTIAAQDEGAATTLIFDYSITSGDPQWSQAGLEDQEKEVELSSDEYRLYRLNFSDVQQVANNPVFKIRIRFRAEENPDNPDARVTFNNAALDATPVNP